MKPLDEQVSTEELIERIRSRGKITEGTCSCRNPRPFQYLSTRVEKGRYEQIYRCDSCGKQIYKERGKV